MSDDYWDYVSGVVSGVIEARAYHRLFAVGSQAVACVRHTGRIIEGSEKKTRFHQIDVEAKGHIETNSLFSGFHFDLFYLLDKI